MNDPAGRPAALDGWRILDLTDESGAYGVRLLSDLGAEVIRVEPPGGAPERHAWPVAGAAAGAGPSLSFIWDNLGKRSVTLDLESTTGQDLFRRLAATADAVVECTTPGYLTARGIGYTDLAAVKPDIVVTSITPFGQTGPSAGYRQTPLTALAAGGLLSTMGLPEGPPLGSGVPLAYTVAGQHAAAFTMIALAGRRNTGLGQQIDVSVQACVATTFEGPIQIYLLHEQVFPRIGAVRTMEPPNGAYPCRDGYFCFFTLDWPALATWIHEVTGDPTLLDPKYNTPTNPMRAPYVEDILRGVRDFCSRLTKAELMEGMHRTGQIGAPIQTPAEVLTDRHLAARDYWVETDLGDLGTVRLPGAPYRLPASPWRAPRRMPAAGADNAAILGNELGLSADDLTRLHAAGVI